MNMNLGKFQETVEDRGGGGVLGLQYNIATEQQQNLPPLKITLRELDIFSSGN